LLLSRLPFAYYDGFCVLFVGRFTVRAASASKLYATNAHVVGQNFSRSNVLGGRVQQQLEPTKGLSIESVE
jgi:hypothetical protein